MPDVLLKRWNDWSAGIGHPIDDGRTPGMAYASGLLGLRGELRPAPFLNVASTSLVNPVAVVHFSEVASPMAHRALVLLPAASSTVEAQGSAYTGKVGNNTTLTYSATVAAYTNGALIVTVANASANDPTGVTFNGDAMTKIGAGSGNYRTSIWRWVAPDVATGNVVVTFAGADQIVSAAQLFVGVHQATSETSVSSTWGNTNVGFDVREISGADVSGMVISAGVLNDGAPDTITQETGQTSFLNEEQAAIIASSGYISVSDARRFHFQYFVEAEANKDSKHVFLYAARGNRFGMGYVLHKVDLTNGDFATVEAGSHSVTGASGLPFAGQSGKYQGFWFFPAGNDYRPRKLSIVGIGDATSDTLDASASGFVTGADHMAQLGDQLVSHVKEGIPGVAGRHGLGSQDGGVTILKVDGTPTTAADWGSVFPIGDVTDRAAGLVTTQGLTFVLMPDGLYSFNKARRGGLVHAGLGGWERTHINIPISILKGALIIPHPTGLLLYIPGEEPINIGVDREVTLSPLPPSGVTELHGGIHHGTDTVADYIYEVYQPDPSSALALLLCGYQAGRDFVWQALSSLTLLDAQTMLGCKVARNGRPLSASYVTPTLWSQTGADLAYIVLDPGASPFRSRADIHKVTLSADAYMSTLEFAEPTDLTRVVVHTSSDLVSGDEFQVSLITDGTGRDEKVGAPITGSGIRHERKLDRHSVSSLVLHVNWTATSTSARVPPPITRIDLFGSPAKGMA